MHIIMQTMEIDCGGEFEAGFLLKELMLVPISVEL